MLKNLLNSINLHFEDSFYQDIDIYVKLLQQWGKTHSLSASLKTNQIEENIFDALYPMSFVANFKNCADIGTGAGYPGMVLAIANRDKNFTLIEPRVKRVAFLNFVKAKLKLTNVTIIQKRVEDIEDTQPFDLVTSRAVTNTTLLLNLTKNIVDEDTKYLFYKGSLCYEELEELQNYDYKIVQRGEHRHYLYF